MSTSSLPISRLINLSITLSPLAAQVQNLSSLLLLSGSTVIDSVQRIRSYITLAGVAADFGTNTDEYAAASLWFSQVPQPSGPLYIGRWNEASSAGELVGAPLSVSQQAIANFTGVTQGKFNITVDGVAHNVTGLNFSAQTNLNGVANVISTALQSGSPLVPYATCTWNASMSAFVIKSETTGVLSTVSFATAGADHDVSTLLKLTDIVGSGAYVVPGAAAETALAAVQLMDSMFGGRWYAVMLLGAQDSDVIAIAGYVEASDIAHFQAVSTQEPGVLVAGTTNDIASVLAAAGYNKSGVQYSSSAEFAIVSAMARILPVDYSGENTAIDLMWKQEPTVEPETIGPSQIAALEAKNCNVFVNYANGTAIFEPGVVASGEYIDTILGLDAFRVLLQNELYNVLYTTPTKVAQTDAGIHQLVTAAEKVCAQFVKCGLFAPGNWKYQGFGALKTGDFMAKGFYVYAAPIASQSQVDRARRVSPPITIAVNLAGAVNFVNVSIVVNQ